MAKIASHTFVDFALGDGVDTRVRSDAQVELASRNGFSNPDFRDIDADGRIEGVELLAGDVPSGRGIYVRWLKDAAGVPQRDTRITRQNPSNTVDLDDTYPVNEPIIEGKEPEDASRRAKLPKLGAPDVEVVTNSKAGFPAGWIGIAVCGVIGNPRRAGRMRFTTPSPVAAVNVGQGNYIRVFLPQLAEGLSGWAILATQAQTTQNAALNATTYFQRILDGRKRIRNPYPLVGPLKTKTQAKTANETYIAGFGEHPPPRYSYGPGGPFTLKVFASRLTYQVRTPMGESADQQIIDVNTSGKGEATAKTSFGSGLSTVTYTSSRPGKWGNGIRVSHVSGGTLGVSVSGKHITVTLGGKTAKEVAAAVNNNADARRLAEATTPFLPGSGTAVAGDSFLSGGVTGAGKALYVRLPRNARKLFPGATEWRLKFEGSDGLWYSEDWQPIDTRARMQTNSPEGYHPSNKPEQTGRMREDATGVPTPDAELEPPEAFGPTYPLPGTYAVRESLEAEGDDSREGPPSPATTVTITQGQYFRVKPPAIGNRLPNAELSEIDPETGDPLGWAFNRITGVAANGLENRVNIDDTTGVLTDHNVVFSTTTAIKAGNPETLRVIAQITRYTSGRLQANVRYLDGTGAQLGANALGAINSLSTLDMEVSVGPSGSGADFVWPAGTTHIQFYATLLGSTTSGARNFGAILYNFGIFRGLAAPRKRPQQRTDLVTPTEDRAASYHPGPYSVGLDNPTNRHADLAGVTLNVVEYYAAYGTPASPDNLLVGYRTPVTPGQTYTPSLYAGWRGVSVATSLLETVVKDKKGNTVQTLGPLVTGVSGTSSDARRVAPTFTAHEDAAYLEIVGGGASDGRVRVYAFQLDAGSVVSAYTNENALTGTMTVTLDTMLPEADQDRRIAEWDEIWEWVSAHLVSTEDDGASTNISFRTTEDNPETVTSPLWSPWTPDFASVPKRRFWQIEAQLNTTDAAKSPLVSWIGVELLRPETMLLRPDGSEYPGSVRAFNVRAPHPKPIYETIVSDSNVSTRRARGNPRDEREMELQVYTDEAVDLLFKDIATGEPNVLESVDLGVRLGMNIDPESLDFVVRRDIKMPERQAPIRTWIHDGDASFEVISEEQL